MSDASASGETVSRRPEWMSKATTNISGAFGRAAGRLEEKMSRRAPWLLSSKQKERIQRPASRPHPGEILVLETPLVDEAALIQVEVPASPDEEKKLREIEEVLVSKYAALRDNTISALQKICSHHAQALEGRERGWSHGTSGGSYDQDSPRDALCNLVIAAKRNLEGWPSTLLDKRRDSTLTDGDDTSDVRTRSAFKDAGVQSALERVNAAVLSAESFLATLDHSILAETQQPPPLFSCMAPCQGHDPEARATAKDIRQVAGEIENSCRVMHRTIHHFNVASETRVDVEVRLVPAPPDSHDPDRPVADPDGITLDLARVAEICYWNEEYLRAITKKEGEEACRAAANRLFASKPQPGRRWMEGGADEAGAGLGESLQDVDVPAGWLNEFGTIRGHTELEKASHNSIVPHLSRTLEFVKGPMYSAKMYVFHYNGALTFAFRGTEDAVDVKSDLTFDMRPPETYPTTPETVGVLVHNGVARMWSELEGRVAAEVDVVLSLQKKSENRQPSNSSKKKAVQIAPGSPSPTLVPEIICTGHSLGGGLATICALYLKLWYGSEVRVRCETFGSLRVGNGQFVSLFNSKVDISKRIVHELDPITVLPPHRRLGYCHVRGGTWLIGHGKATTALDSMSNRGRMVAKKLKRFVVAPRTVSADIKHDHAMINYVMSLEKLVKTLRVTYKHKSLQVRSREPSSSGSSMSSVDGWEVISRTEFDKGHANPRTSVATSEIVDADPTGERTARRAKRALSL